MKNKKNKLNAYSVAFSAKCPVNGRPIQYNLTIQGEAVVLVEALLRAVRKIKKGLHEDIADQLHRRFGGTQVLTASHHGVIIETRRV